MTGVVRCYVQANPAFQFITWSKDRRPFDPNAFPEVTPLKNGSLLIQRVSQEHQGTYRCTPYNIHGTKGPSETMEILVRGLWLLCFVQACWILFFLSLSFCFFPFGSVSLLVVESI